MPGLFDSFSLRGLNLKNRIMVSPMCQYQAERTGIVTDWHIVHYGSMALGGAALMMVEATAVEPRGRISESDLGIWSDDHLPGLKRIVDFAHRYGARIGIQLAHAGRKANVSEDIVAPSAIRFSDNYQVPVSVTKEELEDLEEKFRLVARRAVEAGFDCVEVHAAHGYLLHQFLSPVSNKRTDDFGGSLEGRLRFPLRVVQAVRESVPKDMPVLVRVSASEYTDDGYQLSDMVEYCRAFQAAGVDAIDVSSGGNLPVPPTKVYAGYQVPFAATIRDEVNIPVIAVGILDDPVLADSVIQEERADMIAIARGFLVDKHWGHTAAKTLGKPLDVPRSYQRGYRI